MMRGCRSWFRTGARKLPLIADCMKRIDRLMPFATAADWDNVGLLIGDRSRPLKRFMTCLTLTAAMAEEAIAARCDLIICHHPLPFRPLRQLSADTLTGKTILRLIEAGVAVISPHTAFDNAKSGINEMIAVDLGLSDVEGLTVDSISKAKIGRIGRFQSPISVHVLCRRLREIMGESRFQIAGPYDSSVSTCVITCGSAGDLIGPVLKGGFDAWVVGELTYHRALEAAAAGIVVIAPGHHASECFAIHRLGQALQKELGEGVEHCRPAGESDPWQWLEIN